MKTLLGLLLRLILLTALTFGFVVLFEHGPSGFAREIPAEFNRLTTFLRSLGDKESSDNSPPAYREPDLPTDDGGQPHPVAPEVDTGDGLPSVTAVGGKISPPMVQISKRGV